MHCYRFNCLPASPMSYFEDLALHPCTSECHLVLGMVKPMLMGVRFNMANIWETERAWEDHVIIKSSFIMIYLQVKNQRTVTTDSKHQKLGDKQISALPKGTSQVNVSLPAPGSPVSSLKCFEAMISVL